MNRITNKLLAGALCFGILFMHTAAFVFAEENPENAHQIIFLLDASNSMNKNDPNRLAGDSIKQMVYSLPSNYSVGFVAYNDDVIEAVPPARSQQWNQMQQSVDSVTYTGYTNAGAGLSTALGLVSGEGPKTLVMISDGEIVLQKDAATAEAIVQFEQAVEDAAERAIPIYTIALGDELNDPAYNIWNASQSTGGKIYCAPTADTLQQTVRTILFDDLGVKKSSVGVAQAAAGGSSLKVNIPAAGASKARILITADSGLNNVAANYNAVNGNVINGKRFAVVEIDRPARQEVTVNFDVAGAGSVRGELITEYAGELQTSVTYEDVTDEEANQINRMAEVTLLLKDPNTGSLLLDDPYFNGKEAQLSIDGHEEAAKIEGGKLSFRREVTENSVLTLSLSLPGLDLNLFDPGTVSATLEAPPLLPPKTDYRPLWIIMGALAVVLVALLLWYRSHRIKMQKPQPEPEPPPSIYDFSGKLNLYVTESPDGSDIAPQTFTLYRLFSKKEISLASVLQECGIKLEFRGAANILLQPGASHSLVVTNKSDCTLLKGRELIMKAHSYPVYFEDKLTVTFEDERSELTMIYKNVKPSER